MKKTLSVMLTVLLVLFCFVSCDDTRVPNPLIGSYYLKDPDTGFIHSGVSFAPNNRFVYFEVLSGEPGTDPIFVIDGRYELLLGHYDFVSGGGKLIFKYRSGENWPVNLFFEKGGRTNLWFSWACDRDNGPYRLSLAKDPDNPKQIQTYSIFNWDWKDVKARVDAILGSGGGDGPAPEGNGESAPGEEGK